MLHARGYSIKLSCRMSCISLANSTAQHYLKGRKNIIHHKPTHKKKIQTQMKIIIKEINEKTKIMQL
jgi:hypothetical protein